MGSFGTCYSLCSQVLLVSFTWFTTGSLRLSGSLEFNGLVNLVTLPALPVSLRFLGLLGPTGHLVSLGPASLVSSRMRIAGQNEHDQLLEYQTRKKENDRSKNGMKTDCRFFSSGSAGGRI